MRLFNLSLLILSLLAATGFSQTPTAKLTVFVDGVNKTGGNIGVYVFKSEKGWPESSDLCFRRIVVPAHPGTVIVEAELPTGKYAIAVGHDSNVNHHVDKNWLGKPTEQWGMSNNPHATVRAPAYSKAEFSLSGNAEIHIKLQ